MKAFHIAQDWWQLLLVGVVCYLIGCFNFALFISRSKKRDITKMGSGNPGTMNMSREFGLKIGVITFFCDALKGGIPTLVGYFLYREYIFAGTAVAVADFMRYFCGVCVIIGHIFPITMKFKGGKGIASTFGLFWACLSCESPWWILGVFLGYWLIVLFIFLTEWGSLGSLLGVSGFSIIQLVIFAQRYAGVPVNAYLVCTFLFVLALNVLTWCAHRKNLARLFAGEEHHTSIKKLAKKKKTQTVVEKA
ncbi:MAG: glycerol-3-phosphate acyltransferase [Clostridia bacterium]|nr:glycerol-3-phosphate acyltransferase [Clostridia bacterium]